MLSSYPSIYNVGHAAVQNILENDVHVEEKIDGSQISFGVDESGVLSVRSKGAEIILDAPPKMFDAACNTILSLRERLVPGWTYRGEYLSKPKHNTLAYSRTPANHIIIFDVNTGLETYADQNAKRIAAIDLGLECVPLLFQGRIRSYDEFRSLLDTPSILGGQKIEGVVVKPIGYNVFGRDKKVLMAKFVSENFKESHAKEWKKTNPAGKDILECLTSNLRTTARWSKAVQHLRDDGMIEGSPRDIGALLKEIQSDIKRDGEEAIKDQLFRWAWPHISRKVVAGFPEWYKDELAKAAFGADGE